ncbi:MAG: hypothetical protein RBG13Loki_3830 [Promethearchaeota archaeon CR_4]|nr:MAG: hypothetical protein RBG13Loki_3830 [Candidatus Lokiarchaeota archaeon CR_4]
MTRDIPLTEELFEQLVLVLDGIANGAPLAYGAFVRAPISISIRAGSDLRQSAKEVGIQVTPTGITFSVWQEGDCEVAIAKLADLKRQVAGSLDKHPLGSPYPLLSSARSRDIALTKTLFTRLIAILTIIKEGHPQAFGAYARAPISIPIRTTEVIRYLAGTLGISLTPSGIIFHIWKPEDCSNILAQLVNLQEHAVEFGKIRAELVPSPSQNSEPQ